MLALALLAAVTIPAVAIGDDGSRAPARAAADGLLETITVDPASTTLTEGKVVLQSSTRYTIDVSGLEDVVGSEGYGFHYDALYCFGGIGFDHPECEHSGQPGDHEHRGAEFFVGTDTAKMSSIDRFQVIGGPEFSHEAEYNPNHSYSLPFFPTSTATFKAGGYDAQTGCKSAPNPCQDSPSGSFTVKIYGPATSQKPPPTTRPPSACESGLAARIAKTCEVGTADLPFGTAAVLPAPAPNTPTDISSGKLPANTTQADLDVDLTDAEINTLLTTLAIAKQKAWQQRADKLFDLLGGCFVMGGGLSLPHEVSRYGMPDDKRITSGSMETIILACLHYIERNHLLDSGPTQARAAKSGCRLSFLPIFRRKPSAAARRRALAGVNRDIAAVCKASGPDHNTLHLKARRKATTLNKLFGGKHALANLQRSAPAGSHDGANPRMTVSWNH